MLHALLFSFALTVAHADVPPVNSEGCSGLAAGDKCTDDAGSSGACVASTCEELDYSNGTPPESVQVDCLLCDASAKPAGGGCSTLPMAAGFGLLGLGAALASVRRR